MEIVLDLLVQRLSAGFGEQVWTQYLVRCSERSHDRILLVGTDPAPLLDSE